MQYRFSAVVALTFVLSSEIATAGSSAKLDVDAFRTAAGPTVRFAETSVQPGRDAAVIGAMRIVRPRGVTVRVPPTGRTLGRLRFFVGGNTSPTSPDRRSLRLTRVRSLGGGYYLLAEASGARAVLSTRYRSTFLRIALPADARNADLTLTGVGARLLRFSGCRRARFAARFTLRTGSVSDGDDVGGSRLRRAGLC